MCLLCAMHGADADVLPQDVLYSMFYVQFTISREKNNVPSICQVTGQICVCFLGVEEREYHSMQIGILKVLFISILLTMVTTVKLLCTSR